MHCSFLLIFFVVFSHIRLRAIHLQSLWRSSLYRYRSLTNRNRFLFSNRSNNCSKNCDQQENWAPPDQPVQQRRRSHYVVEVSRRCSTSSDVPNRSQQQQPHCKHHNFTNRASQRSSSQGKYRIPSARVRVKQYDIAYLLICNAHQIAYLNLRRRNNITV